LYLPLWNSTTLKDECNAIQFVLEKCSYYEHKWIICTDLKRLEIRLGYKVAIQSTHDYYAYPQQSYIPKLDKKGGPKELQWYPV